MRNTNAKSGFLLLTAVFVGLVNVPSLSAGAKSWEEETVLISPQGDQTVVRSVKGDKTLLTNADPQLAIEWGLANVRTTVLLAGKYVVSDRIDVPRDDVTLIIAEGAEISLNPDETGHTFIHFRGSSGGWQIVPLIYNHGHDNVRVINFGTLVWFCRERAGAGRQTFPIVFDGRNDQRTCGIEGGMLLVTGSPDQGCWLIDSRAVQVPLMIQDGGTGAEVLGLEGCEDCKLGMLVNLSEKNRDDPQSQVPRYWKRSGKPVVPVPFPPEGMTNETVDLNSCNRGVTIDRLVAERPAEIIDCNESHATVGEVVSIGKPQKLLMSTSGSGPRFTSKPRTGRVSLDVKQKTILEDAAGAALRVEVPKLPDALPRFTVKATVEVTLKDGGKKEYTKEVEVDVRAASPAAMDPAAMDKTRMDAAIRFAETVLKYGRDTYGEKHTPLFVDGLNIDTMKPPEKVYIFKLRSGPRAGQPWQPLISSNLADQTNLMRFLLGLSNLTGDPRYKEAYKDALRYHFQHYQTDSGMLHMGHHRFVELQKDEYDGDGHPPGFAHELKVNFPYYDLFFETDEGASRKLVEGIWNSHVKNWSNLDFTRHAGYNRNWSEGIWDRQFDENIKGITGGALTFYDTACDLILAAGKLYQFSGDEKPLIWARRLLGRYIHSAHPKTGLPPYQHTQMGNRVADQGLPENATEPTTLVYSGGAKCGPPDALFGYGAVLLMRLGEELGQEGAFFSKSVHDYLKAYAKYAYNPEDNTFRPIVYDGTDLSGFVNKGDGYYGAKGTVLRPWKAHTGYLLSYSLCYRQTKDREIWDTLRGICRGNGLGDIGEAGGNAPKLNLDTKEVEPDIIFSLVEIFRATDNRAYLDLASVVGGNILKTRYNAEKGLFVHSRQHLIANLDTREPLALITLEAALRGQLEKVPTYDGNGRFMWARIRGMAGQSPDPWYEVLRSADWNVDTKWNLDSDGRWTNAANWTPRIPRGFWGDIAVFPNVITADRTIDATGNQDVCTGLVFDSDRSYTLTGGGFTVKNAISVIVRNGSHTIKNGFTAHGGAGVHRDITFDVAAGATLTQDGCIHRLYSPPGFNIGVKKIGAGTLIMTADHGAAPDNQYPSRTIISKGTLLINNSTGSGVGRDSVIVEKTGTLGGTGIVGSVVHVQANGAVAPGSGGAGALTLSDGLTLRGGSGLRFELGTRSDRIDINGGTFTVSGNNGVTVSITDAGGLSAGATCKLIDFTGAGSDGVEADDFQLESGGPVKEATFSVVNNVLQVKIDSVRGSAAKEAKYRWHHKPGVELALRAGEKTIWAYHFKADGGFPYVHPLATSDGTCLTALAPDDHPWHRAVWFSWKYLNGVNYWNWEGDSKQPVPPGRTVPVGKETVALEADRARIVMNLHYRSNSRTVLKEKREIVIRVPRDDGSYTMDWRATFTAAETDVVQDRTPIPGQPGGVGYGGYAGLSFRGAASLRDLHSLDSEGRADQQSHGKPARWLDYHAVIDEAGRTAGVTIFDHPANLRHPSPWYISFGSMPYFSPAPIFHKPYTLSAGRSFTLRYRILVHRGRSFPKILEREYKDFSSSE